jgi:hypothetical protein
MRWLLLLALTGCSAEGLIGSAVFSPAVQGISKQVMARPQPWKSVPTTHHRTPLPPSKLVSEGPAFSFIDHGSGTHYWIWLYEDAEALHNQVVVQEQGQYPRDATWEETQFAFEHYNHSWRHRQPAGRLEYARQRSDETLAIHPDELDEGLAGNALELEAQARGMGAISEVSEHRKAVAVKLGQTRFELAQAQRELAGLRGRKAALFTLR